MRAATAIRIGVGAVGVGVLVYGTWGLVTEPAIHQLWPIEQWLIAGVIVHDAILAPAVFLLAAVAYRFTTPRIRRALAAILLIGGSAFLVGLPDLLRKGKNGNPTVTPLDYRSDLIIVIGTVIGATLLFTAVGSFRAHLATLRARSFADDTSALSEAPAPAAPSASAPPVPAATLATPAAPSAPAAVPTPPPDPASSAQPSRALRTEESQGDADRDTDPSA